MYIQILFISLHLNLCLLVESNVLGYERGDLIYLDNETTGETLMKNAWGVGRNSRTGLKGDVSSEGVHILATLREPPPDIIVSNNNRKSIIMSFVHDVIKNRLRLYNCAFFEH
jgi:hypothetical protein